jgi:hypothetical protein
VTHEETIGLLVLLGILYVVTLIQYAFAVRDRPGPLYRWDYIHRSTRRSRIITVVVLLSLALFLASREAVGAAIAIALATPFIYLHEWWLRER